MGYHELIIAKGISVIVYESTMKLGNSYNSKVINDLEEFKNITDVIIANHKTDALADVAEKFYTRYLFGIDS